jgi:hypothetical protein
VTPFHSTILLAVLAAPLEGQQSLILRSDCDAEPACVRMTFDVGSATVLRIAQPQDSLGYTIFAVRAAAALTSSQPAIHEVLVRGYTDGIECSHLGQATVAVLGHSSTGRPIVLSDQGPVSLTDTMFRVGCPDCGRIQDAATGRLVVLRPTPGWDLTLAGTRAESLYVNDQREVVLREDGRAVALTAFGPFRVVPRPQPSRRYRLALNQRACT